MKKTGVAQKIREILTENPEATTVEIVKRVGCSKQSVYSLRNRLKTSAGTALAEFQNTRAALRRNGALPGGGSRPISLSIGLDDRPIEIGLTRGTKRLGTLRLTTQGLLFTLGKKPPTTERAINFKSLAKLGTLFVD